MIDNTARKSASFGGMAFFTEKAVMEAERDRRYEERKFEHHCVYRKVLPKTIDGHREPDANVQLVATTLYTVRDGDDEASEAFMLDSESTQQPDQPSAGHTTTSSVGPDLGRLQFLFQRSRPEHISGRPDLLPFRNAQTLNHLWTALELPPEYLQIADGTLTVTKSSVYLDGNKRPQRYEFIAHCVTKYGDWTMALSHNASSRRTSAHWSMDTRMDSDVLINEVQSLRQLAFHPMLIPCIMFSETLRMALRRRHAIKRDINALESDIRSLSVATEAQPTAWPYAQTRDLERVHELLHSCRRAQASRQGRYELWRSFHEAVNEGFQYADEALNHVPRDHFQPVHGQLKQWAALTWQKLESLKARDIDHVTRVDNVSNGLYNIIQQRDTRIQSQIARAAKRDSEDMKFIAVLGSVFLPASLVASILNVQEFQFLPGGSLFGVYVAITVPLIVVIVTLCVARPHWPVLRNRIWPSEMT